MSNTSDDKKGKAESGSTKTEDASAPADAANQAAPADQQAPVAPDVQPVEGGSEDENVEYEWLSGELMIDELPEEVVIRGSGKDYLLPGAPDETHSLTAAQMATLRNVLPTKFPGGTTLGAAVGPYDPTQRVQGTLRFLYLNGFQKDWNIINGISAEGRAATADQPITEKQERMLFDAIIPALVGTRPHWDPLIQARIQQMSTSTKTKFIDKAVEADNRGDVSRFMRRFDAVVGTPTRRQPGDTGDQGNVMQGAGRPASSSMHGDEEPF